MVANLRAHLHADQRLQDLAYTLQVGREAMPQRLALVVSTVAALEQRLDDFTRGAATADTYRGVAPDRHVSAPESAAGGVSSTPQLAQLAAAWVRGATVDWEQLLTGVPRSGERQPRSVPRLARLPGLWYCASRYGAVALQARP
jgi:acyl transferase domain-containing protein